MEQNAYGFDGIKSALHVEWLRFKRNPAFWVAAALLIYFTAYWAYQSCYRDTRDYANALAWMGRVMGQVGTLIAMAAGAYIASDRSSALSDVTDSMPSGYAVRVLAKALFLIIIGLATLALLSLVFWIFFALTGSPTYYFAKTIPYLTLYILLPTYAGMFIGLLAGVFMRTRYAAICLIPIYLLVTPSNREIALAIASSFVNRQAAYDWAHSTPWFNILSMGHYTSAQGLANPLYGLPLEWPRWLATGALLAFVAMLCAVCVSVRGRYRGKRMALGIAVGVLIVCVTFAPVAHALNQNSAFYIDYMLQEDRRSAISKYYHSSIGHLPFEEYNADEPRLRVLELDIELQPQAVGMRAQALLQLRAREDGVSEQSFSLAHEYTVKSVHVDGNPLAFRQDGDRVIVSFLTPLKQGEEITLLFEYAGIGSAVFFISAHQAAQLPPGHAWYPLPGYTSPPQNARLWQIASRPIQQEAMRVRLQIREGDDLNWFTNLVQTAPGLWEGDTDMGVLLIGGTLERSEVGPLTAYTPISITGKKDGLLEILARLARTLEDVQSWIGIDGGIPLKNVVIISTMDYGTYTLLGETMLYDLAYSFGYYPEEVAPQSLINQMASEILLIREADNSKQADACAQLFTGIMDAALRVRDGADAQEAEDAIRASYDGIMIVSGLAAQMGESIFKSGELTALVHIRDAAIEYVRQGNVEMLRSMMRAWYEAAQSYRANDFLEVRDALIAASLMEADK